MILLIHGETRTVKTKLGDQTFTKKEKYCDQHGWQDLLFVGGESGWQSRHALCNQQPKHSATIEQAKTFAKAA